MRRSLTFLFTGVVAVALLTAGSLAFNSPVSAATTIAPTTTCANSVDNSGGLGLICRVTVVNTITPSGTSAVVTVRECHGAAGDPNAACFKHKLNLGSRVTHVNQCNGSINGGGGTLRCSVVITNRFVGLTPNTSVGTVNQCVGSGDPGNLTSGCDPYPANTTGAAVTQCNGSANGGTLVQLTCTATGRAAPAYPVWVNQCNGSGNGGGALVICSTALHAVIISAVTPPPTARPTVRPTPRPTSPTATAVSTRAPGPTSTPRRTAPPNLPPTSTSPGSDTFVSASGPVIPLGLLLLVGLALGAWFRRQNKLARPPRSL